MNRLFQFRRKRRAAAVAKSISKRKWVSRASPLLPSPCHQPVMTETEFPGKCRCAMHHGPVQISGHPHPRTRPATARDLANTPGFANAQRERKKVEALFAELKNQIGLRRLRLRRLKFVRDQF